jgi:hypothetical protein
MTQIVINVCHGGFSLSDSAQARYRELAGIPVAEYCWELDRSDIHLVHTVLELGEQANGRYADLKVVTIPDDVEWTVHEYDGTEWVAEAHRTWS